jgi:hypothetical protein
MSVYPFELDDDTTLPRVDDNITETGQEAINALRDAVFNVQETLGIEPQGSVTTVANRLDAALNADGTIKASALTSIGLVTLPITNNQVGSNAGIEESKLSLVHSTTDLYTLILANSALTNSLNIFANTIFTDFNLHITGALYLSDGVTSARHVLSHIDLNNIPSDSRDPSFVWTGLRDKDNNLRLANNAAQGLLSVNDALTAHENKILEAHPASTISVNTDSFKEIPLVATDAQSVFNYLDQSEILNMGQHRATQHANAIPKISRSDVIGLDGYGHNVVPSTTCYAYLTNPPNTFPVDDLFVGDDIIKFVPDNSNFIFDSLFSQVKSGDLIRINYGNGLEAIYPVNSIRFTPDAEWIVRINGVNLCSSLDGYASARIDRALYDVDTAGIFATATANARDSSGPTATNVLSSLIVADPRGAMALGLNFDPNQLDSTHYNLHLEFYPTGNPSEKVISLPPIDVTGNLGATPGLYNLSSVISATNDKFREFGYNYRFIAFEYNGEFGIMLADVINNASFAIVKGTNASGTLITGSYVNNVIGGNDLNTDTFDSLGFGTAGSNLASPAYQNTWTSSSSALIPTKVIRPLKRRYAIVNGQKIDHFKDMYLTTNGYWDGYISSRNQLGFSTVETTYTVDANLAPSGIKPGSTIVVQPAIALDDALYNDVDYGRFIVKSVNFVGACGTAPALTQITVLNSIFGVGLPFSASASPNLPVKLYFSYDSISFNKQNIIDTSITPIDYKRFHEIYLSDEGKTFSHERLRMTVQSESPNLLDTNNFHILNVSPKLRGYTDGSPLSFNKFLRFYVLNYDSVTGEFDGYLGQRNPLNYTVSNTGSVVTGKINVVTRFYDETNIDYVDILYSDSSSSPGSPVMSSSLPRYVDFEIFESLQKNDELFLLSTCEVNWDPLSGENIIQYLNNRREFGSIDETDFTESAKDYIAAANKYLHDNGVIRGLDYESTVAGGEIRFKGGSAVISGKVIAANNQGVVIPQIYPQSTSVPQILDWAICLNEFGNLVPIILTASKQLFFATDGIQNYQINSATFNEIINQRKDLCLIAIINVTIASITINSVSDARKFIEGLDSSAPLNWSSGSEYLGNFYSIDSLKYWINNSDGTNNYVKLRGSFVFTESLDLSGFNKTVIFDGLNASVTVATNGSGEGILLGSNLHLQNWFINYAPTGFASGSTTIGLDKFAGSLLFPGGNVSNVKISGCSFYSQVDDYPSFITFNFNTGDVLEDIVIENNKFDSVGLSSSIPYYQPAIQFIINNPIGTQASIIKNLNIKNNFSKKFHGILIFENNLSSSFGLKLSATIENNTCGYIGYSFGSDSADTAEVKQGLIIKNNFTKLIGTFLEYVPYSSFNNVQQSIGPVLIENNTCSWIYCQMSERSQNHTTSLIIKNNTLFADDSSFFNVFGVSLVAIGGSIGIYVLNNELSPLSDKTDFIIDGNFVGAGSKNSITYRYDSCIRIIGNSKIINNTFSGINAGSNYMMYCSKPLFSETYYSKIENNKFLRRGNSIAGYIKIDSENTSGKIFNNEFDKETVDGTSDELIVKFTSGSISGTSDNLIYWSIFGNKNQRAATYIPISISSISADSDSALLSTDDMTIGGLFVSSSTPNNLQDSTVTSDQISPSIRLNYKDNPDSIRLLWGAKLSSILPEGVTVYRVEFSYASAVNPSSKNIILNYYGNSGAATSQTGGAGTWTSAEQSFYLNIPDSEGLIKNYQNDTGISTYSVLYAGITLSHSTVLGATFSMKAYYRW